MLQIWSISSYIEPDKLLMSHRIHIHKFYQVKSPADPTLQRQTLSEQRCDHWRNIITLFFLLSSGKQLLFQRAQFTNFSKFILIEHASFYH